MFTTLWICSFSSSGRASDWRISNLKSGGTVFEPQKLQQKPTPGFEPGILWLEVKSDNHFATQAFRRFLMYISTCRTYGTAVDVNTNMKNWENNNFYSDSDSVWKLTEEKNIKYIKYIRRQREISDPYIDRKLEWRWTIRPLNNQLI